jgi:hypothetical protein
MKATKRTRKPELEDTPLLKKKLIEDYKDSETTY